MANHPSALKRQRQSEKRRARNRSTKSDLAALAKKVAAGGADAKELARKLQSKLDKAARKNVISRKSAARRVSRLAKVAVKK